MELFEVLRRIEAEGRLPFLVIGGHAVNAHGYSRLTFDLDLLIPGKDRPRWLSELSSLGYGVHHDADTFLQLSPPLKGMWPIDLMMVNDSTFAGLIAEATEVEFRSVRLKVPSLEHLFALKLHALKQGFSHREAKDFGDLTHLIHANRLLVRSEKFRQLVERYGTSEIYERIISAFPTGP